VEPGDGEDERDEEPVEEDEADDTGVEGGVALCTNPARSELPSTGEDRDPSPSSPSGRGGGGANPSGPAARVGWASAACCTSSRTGPVQSAKLSSSRPAPVWLGGETTGVHDSSTPTRPGWAPSAVATADECCCTCTMAGSSLVGCAHAQTPAPAEAGEVPLPAVV
jgi:hypothetical protein